MHLNSELLFKKYAIKYFKENLNILEIGPSGYPSYYSKLVNKPSITWNTLDIGDGFIDSGEKNPLHIVCKNEYDYPIPDETYDIVVAGQVMEHVKRIWAWVDELKRITKKGGLIIIVCPVSWGYHEAPVDCWRIYPDGMKALMEEKGLAIKECLFESLEKNLVPKSTPTLPGDATIPCDGKLYKNLKLIFFFNRMLSLIPVINKWRLSRPITVAYDIICVCQK